jgi:nitroreductase
MDFEDLVLKRRSIRDYKDKEVPLEIVHEIVEDSIKAPNSGNQQPWRFIIVNDMDLMKRLSDSSKVVMIEDIEKEGDPTRLEFVDRLKSNDMNVFYNAPCLVYIVGQEDVRSLNVDVGLLVAYFMLSATSRGLGTCWIGMGSFVQDKELLDRIGLPVDYKIVAPIILGYPKGNIPDINPRNEPIILKTVAK